MVCAQRTALTQTSNWPSGANQRDVLDDGWRSQRMYPLLQQWIWKSRPDCVRRMIQPIQNLNLVATASLSLFLRTMTTCDRSIFRDRHIDLVCVLREGEREVEREGGGEGERETILQQQQWHRLAGTRTAFDLFLNYIHRGDG